MTANIRWLWSQLDSNYWFYPALFALAGVGLALGLVYFDRHGIADYVSQVSWLVPARPESASNMLTVISGSMIGVASTVFSITIAAVAYASGSYGPRLLTNFMEDKGNQLSLATFIGTFVYAITVLRTVRGAEEGSGSGAEGLAADLPGFVPQLSLLVAYGLMALSVGVLVFFLNHIPASIRINSVLEGIGSRLIAAVLKTYPQHGEGSRIEEAPHGGRPVCARDAGYVQLIDFEGLVEIAARLDNIITLRVRTGDFVHRGMELTCLSDEHGSESARDILKCFTLGPFRTPTQDPQFLIDELVEIGLRALSPGINDPFTAITAIHWLGAATAELGARDLVKDIGWDNGIRRVFPLPDDFAHYVRRGFGALRGTVATSVTASLVMLDALRDSGKMVTDANRLDVLRSEGDRLLEQARLALAGPDLREIETRHAKFAAAMVS